MTLITAIEHSYQTRISPNPVFIACSGGRDSMVLLFSCHQLHLPIQVIHINHKLQPISDDWQRMVEDFCQLLAVPCQSFQLDWENPNRVNEAQARTARYQAITHFVPRDAIIATAHHANDQAETLLMNLCKGTGLAGLTGMAELSEQQEFDKPIRLWRPLLSVSREQISEFVERYDIPYVDDPTNETGDNQRAFLREQILPKLNARFGKVVENINRTQTNLVQAKAIIDEQVEQDWRYCETANNALNSQFAIAALKHLSRARRFELLHRWVKGDKTFAPNRQLIEQIEALIFSQNPEQQTVLQWQTIQIRRYRDTLYRLSNFYGLNPNLLQPRLYHLLVTVSDEAMLLQDNVVKLKPLKLRAILPNEKFQRLNNTFHEPFKKICQRLCIPSWEREGASVLMDSSQNALAIILPCTMIWLFHSDPLTEQQRQFIHEQLARAWQGSAI